MYKFTTRLPNRQCRICGKMFDEHWSTGGTGAVCQTCSDDRYEMDLVDAGLIRNIQRVRNGDTYTFTFEAYVDEKWMYGKHPCGDWCFVYPNKDSTHSYCSIPVGWWELHGLATEHCGNDAPENERYQWRDCGECWALVDVQDNDTPVMTANVLDESLRNRIANMLNREGL